MGADGIACGTFWVLNMLGTKLHAVFGRTLMYINTFLSIFGGLFEQTITGTQQVLKTSGFTLQFASEALRCDREAGIRKCGRV